MPTRPCTCPTSAPPSGRSNCVTQVAGRTGRGAEGGRVLVQTFSPDHPAIQAAVRHDYARSPTQELPIAADALSAVRRHDPAGGSRAGRGRGAEVVRATRRAVEHCLGSARGPGARPAGPCTVPRWPIAAVCAAFQLQMPGPFGERSAPPFATTTELKPPAKVQWIVDIDPLDML